MDGGGEGGGGSLRWWLIKATCCEVGHITVLPRHITMVSIYYTTLPFTILHFILHYFTTLHYTSQIEGGNASLGNKTTQVVHNDPFGHGNRSGSYFSKKNRKSFLVCFQPVAVLRILHY